MYDNWKKSNQKMILLMVCVLLFAAALFSVFFFDLFPLADELAKGSSVTPADMKLYGKYSAFQSSSLRLPHWCVKSRRILKKYL